MRIPSALAALAACLLAWPAPADDRPEVDVAIVFLVDTSYSMDQGELEVARQSHVEAFRSPEVLAAIESGTTIAVAYAEFGGFAVTVVDWTIIDNPTSAEAFAAKLDGAPGGNIRRTEISEGLAHAGRLIDGMPVAAARIVVDVVGDGMNGTRAVPVGPQREALLDRGAVINGMPLMLAPSEAGLDLYYEETVIGGPGAFSMPLRSIDQMPAALRSKIVLELY